MRRLACSVALICLSVWAGPAAAQYDNRDLYNRIERLERDLQMVQGQVVRGGGSAVITSPAAQGGAVARPEAPPLPSGMAARLDDRVDQLEELVRQLTGRVEEASFRAQQAVKNLEKLQADIDLRFKDLQSAQGGAPAQGAQAPAQLSMPAAGDKPVLTPPGAAAPKTLGSMPEKDMKKALAAEAPKDPQAAYDSAYAALQAGDYATAEAGLKDFLDRFPKHQLAGNAQYWLGETAFVRKDFNTAAVTFLEGYKTYPKHSKAADMIYKAGSAFGQMGKTKEACTAFGILFKDQPKMPDRVKRAATAEKQKYGCK